MHLPEKKCMLSLEVAKVLTHSLECKFFFLFADSKMVGYEADWEQSNL